MIPELRDISYEERRGDQIDILKILNGYEHIDRNMFFSHSRKIAELEDMR